MRNAWALFDSETGQRKGYGDGHLDTSMIGNARVIWRDSIAEIMDLPAVWAVDKKYKAEDKLSAVGKVNRADAKARKAQCAERFLAGVPEPAVIDPSDPESIPAEYIELFDEYWQTYDIQTTAVDPWHLARLIVQKAREKGAADARAASLAEAKLRREKVQAEITIYQAQENMPDE